nr:SprT family zinc-dependent metalloprotease [Ignatzschineria cameli]
MILQRKAIKNLHINVLPPDGQVRISAPKKMSDLAIRMAVIHRIPWIKKQKRSFITQSRQSEREMISGESHYLWGKRYRLEIVYKQGKHQLFVKHDHLLLSISPNTSRDNRFKVLQDFYREAVKRECGRLIDKWVEKMGVPMPTWQVRKMRTMWGSCNIEARRILLNLELAKKPIECLEYVVVHELAHFLERHHNAHFRDILDHYLPSWRERRNLLTTYPLADECWSFGLE